MKQIITFFVLAATLIGLMSACGPSEEELRRRAQARQDSLERVRQERLEQQRLDSIRQARQDSAQMVKEERKGISFNESGNFSIQVEAWRSEEKAQAQVDKWKERGFENAFVVKHGNEDTGNIWFRVRLGKTDTQEQAAELQTELQEQYKAKSWVASSQG